MCIRAVMCGVFFAGEIRNAFGTGAEISVRKNDISVTSSVRVLEIRIFLVSLSP